MTEPRPYRPPDTTRETGPDRPPRRWMEQRPDETFEQWRHRLYRTCYRCGVYLEDLDILAIHEDECRG